MMESLRKDESYTGGLYAMREFVQQARDEHISQTNIEPVYCYHIGVPGHIDW